MMTLRAAMDADLEALGAMGAALARLHHEWDPPRFMMPERMEEGYRWWFRRELQDPAAVLLIAEREGVAIGYAYGRLEERDWNALLDSHGGFHDLFVAEEARGSGAGRALAEGLFERLRALGAPRVVLMSAVRNLAAQRLFASLGWRPTLIEMCRET